jgi:hypothetical protein
MNKPMLYISIGCFLASIICFILMNVILQMGNYSNAKNKESCDKESEAQTEKDVKKCAVWDGSQCRKGQNLGYFCLAQPNKTPLILMIIGVLLFVAFIITAIITFVFQKKPKMIDTDQ